jgi:protein tyrosine phosphatase
VLVSCVGGGKVGGNTGGKETAASAGFLARRRQQQQDQRQRHHQRLSLASAAAAAEMTPQGQPPPSSSAPAPANGNKALPLSSTSSTAAAAAAAATAAAVAALCAARDAAASLLDGRDAFDDFERLRARALRSPPPACDAALHPDNRRKNRYSDVLAPDHSRVVLRASLEEVARSGEEGERGEDGATTATTNALSSPSSPPLSPSISGYINASLCSSRPGEQPPWSYVAAQGPLTTTIGDFWRLVAQLRSPAVVSLTRPEERGVEKCARYLPAAAYSSEKRSSEEEDEDESALLPHGAVFGGLKISCGGARVAGPGLVARRVAVEIVENSSSNSAPSSTSFRHSLLHLHVDDWPDHGSPASSASLRAVAAAMRRAVDEAEAEAKGGGERGRAVVGPPVVHCSAGAFFFPFFFFFFFFFFQLTRNKS